MLFYEYNDSLKCLLNLIVIFYCDWKLDQRSYLMFEQFLIQSRETMNISVCLQVFLVIVWNFELYMLPISLLVIFLKNMFASTLAYNYGKEPEIDVSTGPYLLSCEVRKPVSWVLDFV